MKSQPQILNDWKARLWCRFFLLSVFATMYLNDLRAKGFYTSLGLNVREYDIEVIENTNKTAGRVFPVTLNVEHPSFFKRLDTAAAANEKLAKIAAANQPKPLRTLKQLPHIATIGWQLVQLYFLKPIDTMATRGQVR